MSYELQVYDELINAITNFPKLFTHKKYTAEISKLHATTREVKDKIRYSVCTYDPMHASAFIRHHRRALIILSDMLMEYLDKDEARNVYQVCEAPSLTNYCKHFYFELEQLRDFLEFHYSDYFEEPGNAPRIGCLVTAKVLEGRVQAIHTELEGRNVSRTLISIALEPVHRFLASESDRESYTYLRYLDRYTKELLTQVSDTTKETAVNPIILAVLFSMNFNTERFVKYYLGLLHQRVEKKESPKDQLRCVLSLLNRNNARSIDKHHIYEPLRDNVRTIVARWLEQEIRYLQTTQRLSGKLAAEPTVTKIPTTLSAAELAHIFYLFTETGMIKPVAKMDVHRMIATNFSSKHQPDLSIDSVKNKYNMPESGTNASIRGKFQGVIDFSTKKFG